MSEMAPREAADDLAYGAEACHAYECEEHDYYLSTGCFHGFHDCHPRTCKFCDARCSCSCHGGAT